MLTISLSQSPVQSGLVIFIYTYSKSRILSFSAHPTAFTYSNPIHNFQEKRRPPREKRNQKAIKLPHQTTTNSLTHQSMYQSSSTPIFPFLPLLPSAFKRPRHSHTHPPLLSYPTLYTATTQPPPRLKSQSQSQSQSKPDKIQPPPLTLTLTLTLTLREIHETKRNENEKGKRRGEEAQGSANLSLSKRTHDSFHPDQYKRNERKEPYRTVALGKGEGSGYI